MKEIDALDLAMAEQRSSVWHDIRLGRFTASEIWKLMGSPRSKKDGENLLSETAMTYINIKVGEVLTGLKVESPYAAQLVYGEEMEPQAKLFLKENFQYEIEEASFVPWTDHAGGSPDGYIIQNGKKSGLEIKCPFNSANQVKYLFLESQRELKDEFSEYYWQIQSCLLFTGLDKWVFATYDPRMKENKHKMKILEVFPDDTDQQMISKKLEIAIEKKLILLNKLK